MTMTLWTILPMIIKDSDNNDDDDGDDYFLKMQAY
jgi:hypothetical protein